MLVDAPISRCTVALRREARHRKLERERLSKLISKLVRADEDGFLSSRSLNRQLRMYWGPRIPRLRALAAVLIPLGATRYGAYNGRRGWRGITLVADAEALYHQVRRHYDARFQLDRDARNAIQTRSATEPMAQEWELRLKREGIRRNPPCIPDYRKHGPDRLKPGTYLKEVVDSEIAKHHSYTGTEDRFSDYVWKENDWSQFPPHERAICERWCIDGSTCREIQVAIANIVSFQQVQKILAKHRARAGILS